MVSEAAVLDWNFFQNYPYNYIFFRKKLEKYVYIEENFTPLKKKLSSKPPKV
jgi:hypothetical protein